MFAMIRSKSPFPLRFPPQAPDSPSCPSAFSHLSKRSRPLADTFPRPYFIASSLVTQDRPQPQSSQPLAHTFRHTGGVPPGTPIFEFPFSRFVRATSSASPLFATLAKSSQLLENKTTLSPAFATLTRLVNHNPFVCHSCRKHPGVGSHQTLANVLLSYFLLRGNVSTDSPSHS